MGPVRGHPATAAGEASLEVGNDGGIGSDDEPYQFIGRSTFARNDTCALVRLFQERLRADARSCHAPATSSVSSAARSSSLIQPALTRAAITICSASARDTE